MRFDPGLWTLALAAVAPGLAGLIWLTPLVWRPHWPSVIALFWFAVAAPVVEEILFRGGLQEWLLRRDARAFGPLTRANALASLAFAAAHLPTHAPVWAGALYLPSLIFGVCYERSRRLGAPIALHAFYNACFLTLLGATGGPPLLP
ncbi:MAG: JDVT-CTERM system glutamic-type intramembrane protease [Salinisphaera sp.]|uniref:JDVT-CTERM system glutamic-type intramembrane protease MrtJ n=1 Tax=Salinisphaera sp. TaxID=1914330 RepID=UPI003C79A9C5